MQQDTGDEEKREAQQEVQEQEAGEAQKEKRESEDIEPEDGAREKPAEIPELQPADKEDKAQKEPREETPAGAEKPVGSLQEKPDVLDEPSAEAQEAEKPEKQTVETPVSKEAEPEESLKETTQEAEKPEEKPDEKLEETAEDFKVHSVYSDKPENKEELLAPERASPLPPSPQPQYQPPLWPPSPVKANTSNAPTNSGEGWGKLDMTIKSMRDIDIQKVYFVVTFRGIPIQSGVFDTRKKMSSCEFNYTNVESKKDKVTIAMYVHGTDALVGSAVVEVGGSSDCLDSKWVHMGYREAKLLANWSYLWIPASLYCVEFKFRSARNAMVPSLERKWRASDDGRRGNPVVQLCSASSGSLHSVRCSMTSKEIMVWGGSKVDVDTTIDSKVHLSIWDEETWNKPLQQLECDSGVRYEGCYGEITLDVKEMNRREGNWMWLPLSKPCISTLSTTAIEAMHFYTRVKNSSRRVANVWVATLKIDEKLPPTEKLKHIQKAKGATETALSVRNTFERLFDSTVKDILSFSLNATIPTWLLSLPLFYKPSTDTLATRSLCSLTSPRTPDHLVVLKPSYSILKTLRSGIYQILQTNREEGATGGTRDVAKSIREVIKGKFGSYEQYPRLLWLYDPLTSILQTARRATEGRQDMDEIVRLLDLLLTGKSPPCSIKINGMPEKVCVGDVVDLSAVVTDGYGRSVDTTYEIVLHRGEKGKEAVCEVNEGFRFTQCGYFFLVARVTMWTDVCSLVHDEPVWCSTPVFNVLPETLAPETFTITPSCFEVCTTVPQPTILAVGCSGEATPVAVASIKGEAFAGTEVRKTGTHTLSVVSRKMGVIPWEVFVYGKPASIVLEVSHLFKAVFVVTACIVDEEENVCANSYEGWWVKLLGVEGKGLIKNGKAVINVTCQEQAEVSAVLSKSEPRVLPTVFSKSQLTAFKIESEVSDGILDLHLKSSEYISPVEEIDVTLQNMGTMKTLPVVALGQDPMKPLMALGGLVTILLPSLGRYSINVSIGNVRSSTTVTCTSVGRAALIPSTSVILADPVLEAVCLKATTNGIGTEETPTAHAIADIEVQAVDANGVQVTSDIEVSVEVDTTATRGRYGTSPALEGTTTVQLVNGIAQFSNLIVRHAVWPLYLKVAPIGTNMLPCSVSFELEKAPKLTLFLQVGNCVSGEEAQVTITTRGNMSNLKKTEMKAPFKGYPEVKLDGLTVVDGAGVVPTGVTVTTVKGKEVGDYSVRSTISSAAGAATEYEIAFETVAADSVRSWLELRNYNTNETVKDRADVMLSETNISTASRTHCSRIAGNGEHREVTFKGRYLIREAGWMYYCLGAPGCNTVVSPPFYVSSGPAVEIRAELCSDDKILSGDEVKVKLIVTDMRGNHVPGDRDLHTTVVTIDSEEKTKKPVETVLVQGMGEVVIAAPLPGTYTIEARHAGYTSVPLPITIHSAPAVALVFRVLDGTEEVGKIPVLAAMCDKFGVEVPAQRDEQIVVNGQKETIKNGESHTVLQLDHAITMIEGQSDTGLEGTLSRIGGVEELIAPPKDILKLVQFRMNCIVRARCLDCILNEVTKVVNSLSRPGFIDPYAKPPIEAPHYYLKKANKLAQLNWTGIIPSLPLHFPAVKVASPAIMNNPEPDVSLSLPVFKPRDISWASRAEVLMSWTVTAADIPVASMMEEQVQNKILKAQRLFYCNGTQRSRSPSPTAVSPGSTVLKVSPPIKKKLPSRKTWAGDVQSSLKKKFPQAGILVTLHGLEDMVPIVRPDETRIVYCKVAMGGECYVTEPLEGDAVQNINKSFCFVKRKSSQVLKVMVYAKKKITKHDQFLGEAYVNTCTTLEEGEVSQGLYTLGLRAAGRQAASDLAFLRSADRQDFGAVQISWMPFWASKKLDNYIPSQKGENRRLGTSSEPHPRLLNAVDSETAHMKLVVKIHEFQEGDQRPLSFGELSDELKLMLHSLLKQMKLEVVIHKDSSNSYIMMSRKSYFERHHIPNHDPVFCCVICSHIFLNSTFHFCAAKAARQPATVTRRMWCLEAIESLNKPPHFIGFSCP
eukprot:TRINITY_DN3539_c0_g2_i1.p1 TRINITY_DN3539_c0_g2~~TRINITY_DN3539_c0_g2_i1.p1  ORF type:complete len:2158 (+),score=455.80 TRINITY_DN3539_c0_g2_i1:369-6476(+)